MRDMFIILVQFLDTFLSYFGGWIVSSIFLHQLNISNGKSLSSQKAKLIDLINCFLQKQVINNTEKYTNGILSVIGFKYGCVSYCRDINCFLYRRGII